MLLYLILSFFWLEPLLIPLPHVANTVLLPSLAVRRRRHRSYCCCFCRSCTLLLIFSFTYLGIVFTIHMLMHSANTCVEHYIIGPIQVQLNLIMPHTHVYTHTNQMGIHTCNTRACRLSLISLFVCLAADTCVW